MNRNDYLIKKTLYYTQAKRLVLKNPVNTARIKILLDLYPDAKFIHIYRNPYIVYASTLHFYKSTVEAFMFQKVSDEEIENNIYRIYKEMMCSYFKEKNLIPAGNLVEIKYEDLESDAINQLKRIYSSLDLQGFEKVKKNFLNYLKSLNDYAKNKYNLTKNIISKIRNKWGYFIDKWNYDIP